MTTPNPAEHDSPHLQFGRCGCTCHRCYDMSGQSDDNDGCICKECECKCKC